MQFALYINSLFCFLLGNMGNEWGGGGGGAAGGEGVPLGFWGRQQYCENRVATNIYLFPTKRLVLV